MVLEKPVNQILQRYKASELWLAEVPITACKSGGVVVRTVNSFVSAGTERMLLESSKGGLLSLIFPGRCLSSIPAWTPKRGEFFKRVEILDPKPVTVDVPVAYNDPPLIYELTVTDLFTRKTVTRTWRVQ